MKLVYGLDAEFAEWAARRIPQVGEGERFGPCRAIGVVGEDLEILGAVVFHNWQAGYGCIELSFASASPRWLTPNILTGLLGYAFGPNQVHAQRVTAVTPRSAASALRFLQKFGFIREGVIRRGFGVEDAIVSGLLREEWAAHRFNRARGLSHGQERSHPAARA